MTASRRERQGAILRLISERHVSTQGELAEALREAGYEVVQTTVSRDIADLGLVKVRNGDGRLIYAVPGTTPDADRLRALRAALGDWAVTFGASGNICLITTPSGFANALAQVIDQTSHPLILGTVAGENTIIVVAREGVTGAALVDELRYHLLEGAA